MKTQDEIDLLYIQAAESVEQNETGFPNATYEQGIKTTLEWLMGVKEENPIENDEHIE